MNLNDIDIKLAEYSNPQAINLGFVTARRYFPTLFLASLLATLPLLVVALLLAYFYNAFTWASLLLWWGKPYIDRVILLNASRLLFREPIGLNEILESMPQALKHGAWLHLTLFRFSPARCVTQPIKALEHLQGRDYSERRRIILRGTPSATSVTVGLIHFDALLYIGAMVAILWCVPDSMNPFSNGMIGLLASTEGDYQWLSWIGLPIQAFFSALIEVFYVMVGFMMYLNSRIKSEGWHIDIGFKQIAERLQGIKRVALTWVTALTLGLLGVGVSQLPVQRAVADTAPVTRITTDENRAIVRQLLLDNDPFEVKGEWQPNKKRETKNDRINAGFFDGLLSNGFATFLKIVLIVAGLLGIYWVIANRERLSQWFQSPAEVEVDARPEVLFGLDIRKDSLPDDLAGEAMRLFHRGKLLAVLSLLYRGSLVALVDDNDLEIKESDTEGDCLRNAQSHVSAATFSYFQTLTQAWQSQVYAHRPPEHAHIEALIRQFNSAFPRYHHSPKAQESLDE